MTPEERAWAALNRLCKWRTFYAGWLLGTRPKRDGPTQMVRDLTDASLIMATEARALARLLGGHPVGPGIAEELHGLLDARLTLRAEISAIVGLCIDRGVFTAADLNNQVAVECDHLAAALEAANPGFTATDTGLRMRMPAAAQTMTARGFPQ